MNTSVKKILTSTEDAKVREVAAKMMSYGNRKIKIEFIKKDGSVRKMICSLATNWNTLNGIETTAQGVKMLNAKINNGIATVTEWLEDGRFQPRSVNLATVISIAAA